MYGLGPNGNGVEDGTAHVTMLQNLRPLGLVIDRRQVLSESEAMVYTKPFLH